MIDAVLAAMHAAAVTMPTSALLLPSQALMDHETRLTERAIDFSDYGFHVERGFHRIVGDTFLFETPEGLRFAYRKGEGVSVDRSRASDLSAETLWRNGSVYCAVACINGLLPLHASAVAHEGAVHAFTGPSGAGKSTLITALGHHGLAMFCDDTLVLDLTDPARPMCLPGHKRLKLTPEALEMTGVEAQESVGEGIGKSYALPPAGIVGEALPLARLTFLEEGEPARLEPVAGAQKIMLLQDDHYTANLFAMARDYSAAEHFAHLAALARTIAMARFVRPRDSARFDDGVALVARYIRTSK